MKILILSNRLPFPLTNGEALRVFSFLSCLKGRHEFDLVCYDERPVPDVVGLIFRNIDVFKFPLSKKSPYVKQFFESFFVSKFILQNKSLTDYLSAINDEHKYDLIFVASWKMVVNIPKNKEIPVLMNICDEGALWYFNNIKYSRNVRVTIKNIRGLIMNFFFEKRYFVPLDKCLFAAEIDARIFKKLYPRASAVVVHNGVDGRFFKPIGIPEDQVNIVFAGSMDYLPDVDAMVYFCKKILPIIHSSLPDVKLSIVGKNPTRQIIELESEQIEVTGYVEDIRPYIDRSALFVCPLRRGGGIKNKILQAWSMEKAVVATTVSTGGLIVREGENIVVRDNPKEFAQATIELLQNKEKRLAMGKCARKTALDYYTWEQKANELETVMFDMVKNSVEF